MTEEKEQKRIDACRDLPTARRASRPIDVSKSFSPGTCGRGYRNTLILSWSKDVPRGLCTNNQLPVSSIACPTKPRAKAEESSFHQRDTRYCPYCHPGPRAGIHKKVCEALPPTRYQILSLLSSRPTSRDPEKQPAKRFQPRDTRYERRGTKFCKTNPI